MDAWANRSPTHRKKRDFHIRFDRKIPTRRIRGIGHWVLLDFQAFGVFQVERMNAPQLAIQIHLFLCFRH
jgi:hypothetical protein